MSESTDCDEAYDRLMVSGTNAENIRQGRAELESDRNRKEKAKRLAQFMNLSEEFIPAWGDRMDLFVELMLQDSELYLAAARIRHSK